MYRVSWVFVNEKSKYGENEIRRSSFMAAPNYQLFLIPQGLLRNCKIIFLPNYQNIPRRLAPGVPDLSCHFFTAFCTLSTFFCTLLAYFTIEFGTFICTGFT